MVLEKSGPLSVTFNRKRSLNLSRVFSLSIGLMALSAAVYLIFEKEIGGWLAAKMPMDGGKSVPYYFDLFKLFAYDLFWCAALIAVAWVIYAKATLRNAFKKIDHLFELRSDLAALVIIAVSSAMILFTSTGVLETFPNSSDEYVYVYQANTLSRGRLTERAHPVEKAFGFNHIAAKDDVTVGRFPVGWPMIMAAFVTIGIPAWLANPILAVITLFVFFRLAKKLYGSRVAGWSLLILSFSPFFIFNSASFFSHTSCLLETVVFVYCLYVYLESGKVKYAVFSGLALGLILMIRYYTAVLLFLPVGIVLLYKLRLSAFKLFFYMGLGVLPCLITFLLYNYFITGNPFAPVTVWAYQNEGLGFINGHTVLKGFEHIIRRIFMFVYWCSPVLLVLYVILLLRKLRSKSERLIIPEDYFFLVFIAGYFFYYEIGGNQYGPRFYYEAFAFMLLFVVHKVLRERMLLAKIFLQASVVILLLKLPFIAYRENQIVNERKDVFALVEKAGLSNAVVLLSSGTSVTRPMPAGDLTRNDHDYQNDVLFAVDDPDSNDQLIDYYKDRRFFKYVRNDDEKSGSLIPLARPVGAHLQSPN